LPLLSVAVALQPTTWIRLRRGADALPRRWSSAVSRCR